MSRWQSQIRTNLEAAVYSALLDRGVASTPGVLAAGLVNVRYGEGCLRGPAAEQAPESELARLIALSQWLFPPNPLPESSSTRAALTPMGQVESAFWTTRHERLFAQGVGAEVLVLAMASAKNLGTTLALVKEAMAIASQTGGLDFEPMGDVFAAGLLDAAGQRFSHVYRGCGDHTEFTFDAAMAGMLSQFFNPLATHMLATFHKLSGERIPIRNLQLTTATLLRNWSALPFDPEHLLFVSADRQVAHQGLVLALSNRATDDTVRVWADGLLQFGIDPIVEPLPKTRPDFVAIVDELRALHESDLIGRLRIGGFSSNSTSEGEATRRCKECTHYHPNRKWCDFPELPLPVDAHWGCRLWKA